jgi:hypothetical protein
MTEPIVANLTRAYIFETFTDVDGTIWVWLGLIKRWVHLVDVTSSNFVPYTGATNNVNLGTNEILGRAGQFHSWRIGINPVFGKISFTSDGDVNNPSAIGRSAINFNYNDSSSKSLQYNPIFFSNQGLYWGDDRLLTSIDGALYLPKTGGVITGGTQLTVAPVNPTDVVRLTDLNSIAAGASTASDQTFIFV